MTAKTLALMLILLIGGTLLYIFWDKVVIPLIRPGQIKQQ